jgi:hypothetical protein
MRYGVLRTSPDLPPPNVQRRLIEAAGCDAFLEEAYPTPASQKNLLHFLWALKRGDEILVHGLEAFELTTGELARLLRRFFEAGVTLRIVGGSRVESLAPDGAMPRALALLADHEARRPGQSLTSRRPRTAPAPLTQHQLRFARDMHRRGHSMRAIGLLFRLSPNEVARLLRTPPGSTGPDDAPERGV